MAIIFFSTILIRRGGTPTAASIPSFPGNRTCPAVPYRGPEAGSPPDIQYFQDFHGLGVNRIGSCVFLQCIFSGKTDRNVSVRSGTRETRVCGIILKYSEDPETLRPHMSFSEDLMDFSRRVLRPRAGARGGYFGKRIFYRSKKQRI
jgi:hypothetical protein